MDALTLPVRREDATTVGERLYYEGVVQELGRDCDLLYVCPSNSALAHLPYLVALDNATRCGPNLNPNPRSADAPLGRRVQAAGACSLSLPALPWRKLLNRSATHVLPRVFLCCRLMHFNSSCGQNPAGRDPT